MTGKKKRPKRIKKPAVHTFVVECPNCMAQAIKDLDDRGIPYQVNGSEITSNQRAYKLFRDTGRIWSEG